MAKTPFDQLDLKILNILASNARKPFLEISRECNVSGAAIHQRIQKLTNSGIIRGFETLLNPAMLGFETCAYIGFFLSDPSRLNEIIAGLKECPEVVECHICTGRYDLIAKIWTRNNDHLLDFIQNKLQALGVGRTETIMSFKEAFRRQIPIEPQPHNQ